MLTKQDLNQIKKVVRNEVVSEAKNTERNLRSEMKMSRIRIQSDLSGITDRLINLEQQSGKIAKDIKQIKKDARYTADFLDRENLSLVKRVKRLEINSNLPLLADF